MPAPRLIDHPAHSFQVAELLELQRRASKGVISLDNAAFDKFASGKSRPYSLFLFADAQRFRKQSKLQLETRFEAFATVARAFAATHADKATEGKAFFVRVLFEDARETFGRLGVKGLPYVVRLPPSLHIRPGAAVSIPKGEEMPGGAASGLDPQDYGAFVQDRTGLWPGDLSAAGAAQRSRFLPLFTLAFLAGAAAVGWQLYQAPFMRSPGLYAAGGVLIFWFSYSGGMFNIIRDVPFVGYDPRTKSAVLFTQGSGQVGAEGFIMGTLYMGFALLVATAVRVLPTVKDDAERRKKGWVMLFGMFLIYLMVTGNHAWKTHVTSFFYL